MRRDEITEMIVATRAVKGLTWASIATSLGTPLVWTTAALLGEHPFTRDQAELVADLLDLPAEVVPVLTVVPVRGVRDGDVPTDPTIYRLYEAVSIYGPALKELIHEQFGDGIMSAINFGIGLEKESDPAGDRVVITFNGKFLPYEWRR